ncbi:general transcription factor II-I repeat domain-containing protein 2-like isoform X2 [Biomphalaria pfeifferi]|uniref:General transcription factor II-I repeat domain-containing protein 2-like isoform X2 n=1 Tax=Biomphalaria pfeifferi TaxID=112525 RepID=A0AAD8B6L6_BIOPF|nr:general transcription factor II-I repeat domain-containing protein 2-like isoform X2 [Biomphalaria pfeifferi]
MVSDLVSDWFKALVTDLSVAEECSLFTQLYCSSVVALKMSSSSKKRKIVDKKGCSRRSGKFYILSHKWVRNSAV